MNDSLPPAENDNERTRKRLFLGTPYCITSGVRFNKTEEESPLVFNHLDLIELN